MKVPKHFTLPPHTYSIRTDDETARLLRDEDSRGDSRPDQLVIRLDTDRPHTAVAETLLHEALHCCWNHTALGLDTGDDNTEERTITALAPLLLTLLRANPDLVTYLTADG
jgi:hypothetical protein